MGLQNILKAFTQANYADPLDSIPWLSAQETEERPKYEDYPSVGYPKGLPQSKIKPKSASIKSVICWAIAALLATILISAAVVGLIAFARKHGHETAPVMNASGGSHSHGAPSHSHQGHEVPPNAGKHYAGCGASPQEARERGCIYEPQLSAWNPPECVYPEIIEQFQETMGDMHAEWPWYWDRNLTDRVQPSQFASLQTGNYEAIYTDYYYSHSLHCLYCWRKVAHALQMGVKMIDTRCHQFWHAKHCVEHIAGRLEEDRDLNAPVEKWAYPLMYHGCVELTSTAET